MERLLNPGKRAPLLFHAHVDMRLSDFIGERLPEIRSRLMEHGALLFRGFAVSSAALFEEAVDRISTRRLRYLYRSTPRTDVGRGIYTASEYPAHVEIPLHNENSYQTKWPMTLAFCCLVAAKEGGETPIADMRIVTRSVGTALMDRFNERGVAYIRHYQPFVDLSWQAVFQTESRADVATYCTENGIVYEWLDEETLRTMQVCQGVARHPDTHESFFFNQAHLFHVSSLGEPTARSLIETLGPDRLPRHARYGNGSEITPDELLTIRRALRNEEQLFRWEVGDVLLLDNMQMAHGRKQFRGERRVVAALMDPFSTPANVNGS